MAEHQTLYRTWRPQQFGDVVNQTAVVKTLVNALIGGEVGHAYLFAGPRGTGKTTVARLFARAINCEERRAGEPCNRCGACTRIGRGASLDVVEVDGASNRGIDQIRKLREEVNFVPADVAYKVYIIDEVHMLTNEAFNALLKTLEEPPKRVVFIFATTEPHKLPATVTSRCQAFEFTRIAPEAVAAQLTRVCQAEGIQADTRALAAIASRCGGALRDALVTLEQVAAFAQGVPITGDTLETVLGLPAQDALERCLRALLAADAQTVVALLDEQSRRGHDLELFLEELIRLGRTWLVRVLSKETLPVDTSARALAALTEHLLQLKQDTARVWDKQIWLEVGMVQLMNAPRPAASQPDRSPPPAQPRVAPPPSATPKKPVHVTPPQETAAQEALQPAPDDERWQALLLAVRRERVAVYAYLVEGRPRFEQSCLRLDYRAIHRFHKESLDKAEIRAYVLEKVRLVYGSGATLELNLADEEAAPRAKKNPASSPSRLKEKVDLVKKILGAQP